METAKMKRRQFITGGCALLGTTPVFSAVISAESKPVAKDEADLYVRKVVLFEREDGWFDVDPDFPGAAHWLGHLSRVEIEGCKLVPGIDDGPFLHTTFGRRNGQLDVWFMITPETAAAFTDSWWARQWIALVRRG